MRIFGQIRRNCQFHSELARVALCKQSQNGLICSPIQQETIAQPAVEMSVTLGGEDGADQVQSLAYSLATHVTSTRWVAVGGGQKRHWRGGTGAAVMVPLSDSAGMVNTMPWPKGLRNYTK
jgi:hypothetical protein